MKKISKKEVERIKNKAEEQSFLDYLFITFGIGTLMFYGLYKTSGYIPALIFGVVFFVLFCYCLYSSCKWALTSEEKEVLRMQKQYEEAKVHKEALDTYNKLNKVFN